MSTRATVTVLCGTEIFHTHVGRDGHPAHMVGALANMIAATRNTKGSVITATTDFLHGREFSMARNVLGPQGDESYTYTVAYEPQPTGGHNTTLTVFKCSRAGPVLVAQFEEGQLF